MNKVLANSYILIILLISLSLSLSLIRRVTTTSALHSRSKNIDIKQEKSNYDNNVKTIILKEFKNNNDDDNKNKNDNKNNDEGVEIALEIYNRALDTIEDVSIHIKRAFNPFYQNSTRTILDYENRDNRPRIVIVGSGWAAHSFLKTIETDIYHVICVSPRPFFLFTPMLTGTCVGSVEYRSIVEPIRSSNPFVDYLEGEVIGNNTQQHNIYNIITLFLDIDKKNKKIIAKLPKVQGSERPLLNFKVGYDHLVIACGVAASDFGLTGVSKYTHYLKEISDSKAIKQNILDCFELATIPETDDAEVERLLTFVAVGGGPTGVEFIGELTDFVTQDVVRLYPRLKSKVKIVIVTSSSSLLSTFDKNLQEIALQKLTTSGVTVILNARVIEVSDGSLKYKIKSNDPNNIDEKELRFGVCVWAAGTASIPLIKTISSTHTKQNEYFVKNGGKLAVDGYYRVLDDDDNERGTIFALGDCSYCIENESCPQTAQVAAQQGAYLARLFNREYNFAESIPSIKKNMFDLDPLKFSYLYLRNITNARPFKFINLGT